MSSNSVGNEGAYYMAEGIKASNPNYPSRLQKYLPPPARARPVLAMCDPLRGLLVKTAPFTQANRTLAHLDVSGNSMGGEGASHISEALKDNSVRTLPHVFTRGWLGVCSVQCKREPLSLSPRGEDN